MKNLFLIPARGGSKGIPRKNIKLLAGKPLILYSLDVARQLSEDTFICVSTDDLEIKRVVEDYKLPVPFIRPAEFATDTAGSHGMMMHALEFFEKEGIFFDTITLLQPTSPFRKAEDVNRCLVKYAEGNVDMVVSVVESNANPYYNLFEESSQGYLVKSKESVIERRQDAPVVYSWNGAVYVINVDSLKKISNITKFPRIKKCVMDPLSSLDLDTFMDWEYAEFLIERAYIKL